VIPLVGTWLALTSVTAARLLNLHHLDPATCDLIDVVLWKQSRIVQHEKAESRSASGFRE